MNHKTTISFLASHGGSSARLIIEAIRSGLIPADTGIVITNNRDSAIFQWCCENNFPIFYISARTHPDPKNEDTAITQALIQANTDLVILSGYMKKIRTITLKHFSGKIMNIHPSLLPKYGGQGMYGDRVHQAVLDAGDEISGASVQLINEIYDDGPVLLQKQVPVLTSDTVKALRQRVQAIEGGLYIEAIQKLLNDSDSSKPE